MKSDKINDLGLRILSEIRRNKYVTIPELKQNLNKSEATIYRYLKKLMDGGVLKRNGSRKTGHWEIIDN